MPRIQCPHCSAGREIESSALAAGASITCSACGKSFTMSPPARGGSTQKLSDALVPSAGSSAPRPENVPATMGPYEIRGVVGAGGMGVVYRGWDARLSRPVAVKTLKPELAQQREYCERFLREARAAAALSHPNVCQIYFIGDEAGSPFFAMEYLEGRTLEGLTREEGKLPPERAIGLIRQAALGLKAAAARGIIHRDIKPSNLVLTPDGTLKVTDFGLAKLVVADAGLTMAGEVLGSPNYLAPEQASGAPSDLRSDIYSLGATLYELLTGRPPFEGPTPVSIILKHVREPVRSPRQFSPDLPFPLVALTQRMLAKRPEDRPRDYDALIRELDRISPATGGAETRRMGPAPVSERKAPEPPRGASSNSWIMVPILVLALLAGWGLVRQARARNRTADPSGSNGAPAAESRPEDADSASSPGDAASPAGGAEGKGTHSASSETKILAASTEVSPPSLGPVGGRRTFDLPPRLERLREAAHANLQFAENTHEITQDGRLRVKGSVANTGLGPASDIRIRVTLTDASGQILSTTEVPLSPTFLPARQSGTFEALFPDPHQSVNIRTELSWKS
jgi:eukaryotic-like serine/threonine-protein kinase